MANKLIAIVNVWDGDEFLPYLLENTKDHVDGIVVVWQDASNFGESYMPKLIANNKTVYTRYVPKKAAPPAQNETAKRNHGLQRAVSYGATHVLMMDIDEFYDADEFERAKEYIYSKNLNGLVCQLECFFKEPTLSIGIERTLVPFIQKVTPKLQFGQFKDYPFAYDQTGARIDPTRRPSHTKGIEMIDITMYHYSHVRRDYMRKINNSTAKANLLKSTILDDYNNAKPGYFCKYYQKELIEVENKFNIHI